MLRFRLLALAVPLVLVAGCRDDDPGPDPSDRYEGDVPPCEVVVARETGAEPEGDQTTAGAWDPARLAERQFWHHGPYPIWNTAPAADCPQNPTIPVIAYGEVEQRDVALYITYPSRSNPTRSGKGDVAEGKWPVIVFAHANNDRQCDIYSGYYSLHDHWASWGYVVVAIDGTFTNCNRGTRENLWLRTLGQLEALETLKALNEDPTSRFYGHLDLERVVMAGHSRGGGSSLLAATERPDVVRAVIALQGVDITAFGFGSAPLLPDIPVQGITAGKDVDLDYPAVEPTEDQLAGVYSWIDINGAIHAYTGDTVPLEPDDYPDISRKQQHDITEYFTTAFLARFVGVGDGSAHAAFEPDPGNDPILFSHQGQHIANRELSELGVYSRWNLREGLLVDDFGGAVTADPQGTNRLGGENVCEDLARCEEVLTYKPDEQNPAARWRKSSSRLLVAGASAGSYRTYLAADRSGRPVDRAHALQARVKGPDEGAIARFSVEIETTAGRHRVDGHAHLGPTPLTNRFTQLVVPLDELDTLGDDGSGEVEIVSIALHVEGGSLFVDDLRLAPVY